MFSKSTVSLPSEEIENNNGCLKKKNHTLEGKTCWGRNGTTCGQCGTMIPPNGLGEELTREDAMAMRTKFPSKIPVVMGRLPREANLPVMSKNRFLVPQDITVSQFQTIVRGRLKLHPTQSLFLLINNKAMVSLSMPMSEVYKMYVSPNGFLYITYASQEAFGSRFYYNEEEERIMNGTDF